MIFYQKKHSLPILFFFLFQMVFGQLDSLVFDSGKTLTGEIKTMQKGILEIDVPFGDSDFKIKWLSIKEIYTQSKFLVGVKNKTYNGQLASIDKEKVKIFSKDSIVFTCTIEDIVYLTQYKEGFSNRFSAALEVGFNLTKAQDVRQFSLRSSLGYKTAKSTFEASYNMLRATQNNVEDVKRTDGLLNYSRILFNKWYGIAAIQTLSNTEQKIDLRANSQIGIGNYLFANNRAYWGLKVGINNNLENYSNSSDNRNTWENFIGTELNLYDIGNLNLNLNIIGYTGISENGRFRVDSNLDLKYDLPLDLFVRFGFSLNYDNQPALNASETDYVLRTGIGWEW